MTTLKDILAPSFPRRSAEDIVADLAKNGYVIVGPLQRSALAHLAAARHLEVAHEPDPDVAVLANLVDQSMPEGEWTCSDVARALLATGRVAVVEP